MWEEGELPQFVTTEELAAPIAGPTPQSSSTANNSRLKDFRKYVIAASMGHLSNIPANALEANEKANNRLRSGSTIRIINANTMKLGLHRGGRRGFPHWRCSGA
ncbi:hypothetical protein CDAR_32851 [Caerostris darwini]|uniref:Uncharacterized protein n=1 Tax=Caerostris darwini TaxID=1538125 RepID=A0AAV4SIF7_9ARAC|nr:hypothetical protein CDAR_32851 [Caerostris darwini]